MLELIDWNKVGVQIDGSIRLIPAQYQFCTITRIKEQSVNLIVRSAK